MEIVLTTLNARWIHASFGLRYLHANLGELRGRAKIVELTNSDRPIDARCIGSASILAQRRFAQRAISRSTPRKQS